MPLRRLRLIWTSTGGSVYDARLAAHHHPGHVPVRPLRPAHVIKAAGCQRGIYAEHSHSPHPLHMPSTDSVTVHGAEVAWDSASNDIIYDIALSRISTVDLRFYRQ